jgi:hypothetical protein
VIEGSNTKSAAFENIASTIKMTKSKDSPNAYGGREGGKGGERKSRA